MPACSVTSKDNEKNVQYIRQAFKDLKNIMVRQAEQFVLSAKKQFLSQLIGLKQKGEKNHV